MNVLFFDVESTLDESRLPLFEDDLNVKADKSVPVGDYADEEEFESALIEKRGLIAATTPEYLRIIGMNLGMDEAPPRSGWVGEVRDGGDPLTERDLLEAFWSSAKQAKCIVGFNSIRFDLPAIYVRSALLGVEPTIAFYEQKPWNFGVIDLLQARWPYRAGSQFQSLKALRRILLPPIPEEFAAVADTDGGDVGALWAAGDFETCGLYGRLDIWTTRELCRHWGGYFFPRVLEKL